MYQVKFFKGCLPQILLGSVLNTGTHIFDLMYVYFEPILCKKQRLFGQAYATRILTTRI